MIPEGTAGIYEIRNIANGKRYVGSSKHMERRFREHRKELKAGSHYSISLQNAWIKHGECGFEFKALAFLEQSELRSTEQRLIDSVFANEADTYNTSKSATAPMLGRKHSEKTLLMMSEQRKGDKNAFFGKKMSDEHKAKLVAIHTGKPSWSKGLTFSDDHKRKLSDAKIGKHPWNYGKTICKHGHLKKEISGRMRCPTCAKTNYSFVKIGN